LKKHLSHGAAVLLLPLGACTAGERPPAPDELSGSSPRPASSPSQAPTAGPSGSSAPAPSDLTAPACAPYPVPLSFLPAEAEARLELATFAPGAALTWSSARATPTEIFGTNAAFACDGDVHDAVFALLESHPALFRIDRDDWEREPPFACSSVTTPTLTLSIERASFGGQPVHKDKVSLFLRLAAGGLVLDGLYGSYLPRPTRTQAELLKACAPAPTTALEATARATSYGYQVYDQCAPYGGGTYAPDSADRFELDGAQWTWDDAPTGVTMRRLRRGRILIDPSNLTPELTASDAYCGPDARAGFTLIFDDVTGELLEAWPGVDGCIVCLGRRGPDTAGG
jgi:hypothetical protein